MIKEVIKPDMDDNKIINFEEARKGLLTGGDGGDENWLKGLEVGTIFLARPKKQKDRTLMLDVYLIQNHEEVSTCLAQKLPDLRTIEVWVKTLEFSRAFELVEVLSQVELVYAGKKEEEQSETTDGNSDRPV